MLNSNGGIAYNPFKNIKLSVFAKRKRVEILYLEVEGKIIGYLGKAHSLHAAVVL